MRGKSEGVQKTRDMRRIDAAIQKALLRPDGKEMPYEMQKYLIAQAITTIIEKNQNLMVSLDLFMLVEKLTGVSMKT